jgi:tousled-like kinase
MVFLLIGSSHSDKEMDNNTPEKVPRSTERKRKRKAEDGYGGSGSGGASKGSRDSKKISEFFAAKHPNNSPIRHGGAKSPSPQQAYVMVSKVYDLLY